MAKSSTNEVYISKEGFLVTVFRGGQTVDSMNWVYKSGLSSAKELRKKRLAVLHLVDMSKLGKTSSKSRKQAVRNFYKLKFDRMTLFGASLFNKYMINLAMVALGMPTKMRYFDTAEEAKAWLRTG